MLNKLKQARNKMNESWNDPATLLKINHTLDVVRDEAVKAIVKAATVYVATQVGNIVLDTAIDKYLAAKDKLNSKHNKN